MSDREKRLLARQSTKQQQEEAGLKNQPSEAKATKKKKEKKLNKSRKKGRSVYRIGKNALTDGELLDIVLENINGGTGVNKLARKYHAPKSVIRNAIKNHRAGLPIRTKQTRFRVKKLSDEFVALVTAEIAWLTQHDKAPILKFSEDQSKKNKSSGNSARSSKKSETFLEVVKRVHNKMLEDKYGKNINDIPVKLRLKLSESSCRKLAKQVGVIGKTSSGSSIQNERRAEAQGDICNYISLAVAMQAVSSPLLKPELTFNLDKSSSFLHNASETKFIYSKDVGKQLRAKNRSVKVTKTTAA